MTVGLVKVEGAEITKGAVDEVNFVKEIVEWGFIIQEGSHDSRVSSVKFSEEGSELGVGEENVKGVKWVSGR